MYISVITLIMIIKAAEGRILSCYTASDYPAPSQIDANLCTHLFLIGSTFVNSTGHIQLPNRAFVKQYAKLKLINPELRFLITLTPNNEIMSQIVADSNLTQLMATTLVNYMRDNYIDGFDIDWEFPAWSEDARKSDRQGLNNFLRIFRNEFDKSKVKFLLVLTIGAPYTIVKKGYDLVTINTLVDLVQIMTYDFHDFRWYEPVTGFNAPLYKADYEFGFMGRMNSDYSVKYVLKRGISKDKLVFGIPTYGKGYTLLDKYLHFPYAPAIGPSKYGDTITYEQVCNATNNGFSYHWSQPAATPYWVSGNQWLSCEDENSVQRKTDYALDLYLAGVMIFGLHTDDVTGKCANGSYPLIRAIKHRLYNGK